MRSDAIDDLLSRYFELPAKVSWNGAIGDSVRGIFEGGRLELSGVAVFALPFDRLIFEADRFQFTPGIPARISAMGSRIEVSIDQKQIDRWLARARAPISLRLIEGAVELEMKVGDRPIGRTQTELRVENGWFILRPKHAEFLGWQNRLAWLFRTYIPLPRLAPQTRLVGIRHVEGAIRLQLGLADFEEEITPGLVDRIRDRFLPFARAMSARSTRRS